MKPKWTEDNTETLRQLTEQSRGPDGRIQWKAVFATPQGQQLLKGRTPKDVQNRYTWYIANKPAPEPAPTPVTSGNGSWTPDEEAELARLVNKYAGGKGVMWKRMAQEEPEALARLLKGGDRSMAALRQKYLKGPGAQRRTNKKRRALEHEVELEVQMVERPLPHFCYNCGANLTPVNKGLELYHKLKHR